MKNPQSKKHTTAQLPDNWRELVWQSSQTRNTGFVPFRFALATAILTGCRPAELEAGIKYQVRPNGLLAILIHGAKVGQVTSPRGDTVSRGIAYRVLDVNTQSPYAQYIIEHLAHIKQTYPNGFVFNKTSFRQLVVRAGLLALAGCRGSYAGVSISPYCFRHAMGSDLKSCDSIDDITRACVMGHACTSSLVKYGRRRKGGGGVSPVASVAVSDMPRVGARFTPIQTPKPVRGGYTLAI